VLTLTLGLNSAKFFPTTPLHFILNVRSMRLEEKKIIALGQNETVVLAAAKN